MTISVVGNRILLKPHFDEEVIKEGALKGFKMDVGETFKREKAATVVGEVIGIGPNAWHEFDGEPWCEVGDIVYFAKFGGKFVTDDEGEELILINDLDIQAIYRKAVHKPKEDLTNE